ncbi:MAG TPA: (deoxy)nucleoside triphosphate pyrophosphohydrolase [Chitinophagaceae bacterium]
MIPVTCALILHHGRVLATRRSPSMPLPGKWEFPGGKLHEGESEEDCIRREIREELALDIRILRRLTPSPWHYDTFAITLIPFVADYTGGVLHLAEHSEARWLTAAELPGLDWAPADVPIVEELLKSGYL